MGKQTSLVSGGPLLTFTTPVVEWFMTGVIIRGSHGEEEGDAPAVGGRDRDHGHALGGWNGLPGGVHQALAARCPIGYTTVQTRLNRLVTKGVVGRTGQRPARYEALVRPDTVGARHIDLLLEKIRGFQVVPLVAHLIRDRRLTPAEVATLKELIAEAEEASRRLEK